MAIRDKMAARARPFLEPDEQVRHVFIGQTGPSPYFALLSYLILIFFAKMRMVIVTDRAIVVLHASKWMPARPKRLVTRIPRNTALGPVRGALWAPVQLGPERVWVHKRFHKDVQAADLDIGADKPPAPPGSPASQ
jgi:hypothetical protein